MRLVPLSKSRIDSLGGGGVPLFIEWICVYKNESICNILPGIYRHKNISITLSVIDPSGTLTVCYFLPEYLARVHIH